MLAALPARAQETAAITRGTGDTVAPGQVLTVDVALTSAELDDLETSPDVVLLDCALLTKGEVTLRHIRQRWLTAPVLVIGAHDDFEGSACSMAAEADGLSAGRTPS